MQDQVSESGGSPKAPVLQRATAKPRRQGNHEKLEADRALYERLQRCDFTGWEMDLLRDDLWLYGWKCLRAWVKDGTIIAKCGERGIVVPVRWPEVETLTRRGDLRDEVAHKSVESAVWTFTEDYLPGGRWDPDKGATMRTYFVRTCMYAFRDVFEDWSRRYRRSLFAAAAPLLLDDRPFPGLSHADSAVFHETVQRILKGAGPEVRAICGYIWETKTSHKEIGDALGMTSRAVEGRMRRLRAHANLLVAEGEIEALYGRISAPKADAR